MVRRFPQRSDVGKTRPAAPLIILMFIGALLLVRRMRLLEMGDDSACALGVSVERSRLMLMLVAVLLTAASTAIAGPISFIALVAPHIARRLSGTARWGLTGRRCAVQYYCWPPISAPSGCLRLINCRWAW